LKFGINRAFLTSRIIPFNG